MKLRLRPSVAVILLLGLALLLFLGRPFLPLRGSASERTVTVGLYDNPPKIYLDGNGKPAGLFVDLLQPIASREHWSLRFVHCAWSDCLQYLRDGRIDLMPDVAYSEERARQFDFHRIAAAHSWSQVYRRPQVDIRSVADLAHRRIAILRNGIQHQYLVQLMAGSALPFTPVLVNSFPEGFQATRDGRTDAVVSNAFFGAGQARRYGLVETPIMFEPVSLYFATAKGRNPELLARIDHYLTRWRQDPDSVYFAAIRNAMAPEPVTIIPRWLRYTLLGMATLALLLLGFGVLSRWEVRRKTIDLQRANRRLDQVIAASPVVLFLLQGRSREFAPQWVSPNIQRVLGYPPQDARQPGWWAAHLHPDDRDSAMSNLGQLAYRGQLTQTYRFIDAAGRTRHIHEELRVADTIDGETTQIVGTWSDITQAREHEAELGFLALHDTLTGLGNRAMLQLRLTEAIDRARTDGTRLAIVSIDLDRFRNVNDTLGHTLGDELLRTAARRIGSLAGRDDFLARIGGDEFVLVLCNTSTSQASAKAQQLLQLFSDPLTATPHAVVVTASVGISVFPDDGADADTLLKHADLALYEAKGIGYNNYRVFASALSAGAQDRVALETALRSAVALGQLLLHYQPQVDLASGKLIGVEALARWNHPELGSVPPGRFIPLAEELGLIDEIGAWVLREACRQMAAWQDAGLFVPSMAVNLSVQQIERDVLPTLVADVLREAGLAAGRLELEITESTIMREPEKAIAVLRELHDRGVKISIDDFGIGHSSLAYVKRLPVDRLKIDQSFVREIGRDSNDEAICRTVIELARSLGLDAIAEGVERDEQIDFLRAEGCQFAQGYLFSKPLPAAALQDLWQRGWRASPRPPGLRQERRGVASADGPGKR
ncbi:EAL domain-containing protein [Cognatiluteimonas profundi]|uniref:EAL domain-containing protein n=1 Tax=Cognatiluteimonas profundi TaxID=2594501 RepID=UPI00131C1855|nr:EAL domain-containing protein [Lysobacter profundi]